MHTSARWRHALMSLFPMLLACFLSVSGCSGGDVDLHVGKNVVIYSEPSDPKSLDPHRAGDVVSSRNVSNAYEMLYEYDYFARPQKVVPGLAADLPEVSEGGRVYTIKLRKDVYFQDDPCFPNGKGRQMTADDVVYSLKRFAGLPDTTGWWTADGKFEGLNEFRELALGVTAGVKDEVEWIALQRELMNRPLAAVRKIDDFTVQYRLAEPFPQFTYVLTMSYYAVMAREAVEYYGKRIQFNPVGTGPFRLKDWNFNFEVVWERNPNFRKQVYPEIPKDFEAVDGLSPRESYQPFVGKTLPLADEVRVKIIKESQTAWLNFLAGNIDFSGIGSDEFTAVIQNEDLTDDMRRKGIILKKYQRPIIEYIAFNMNDKKIGAEGGEKAKAIRKAFSCGMDRQRYINDFLNGRGTVATMLVPPSFPEFDGDYTYKWSQFDPEAGRKILTDAGFTLVKEGDIWQAYYDKEKKEKVQLTVLCRGTSTQSKDMAAFLNDSGRRVGIETNAQTMQFPEFLQRQHEGTGQSYNAGWVMDYPDAENIMGLLFGKNAVDHGVNSSRYKNPKFDELFNKMKLLNPNDPEELVEKRKLVLEMHKILEDDCPWATIYFQKQYRLNHEWNAPNAPNDFFYGDVKYFASDSAMRAQRVAEWQERPLLPGILLVGFLALASGLFFFKVYRQE